MKDFVPYDNDLRYAVTRMVGSFFKIKEENKTVLGKIIEINGPSNSLRTAKVFYTLREYENSKSCSIFDIDYYPGKLGYTLDKYDYSWKYLQRLPLRRDWKQGLRNNQLVWATSNRDERSSVNGNFLEFNYDTTLNCLENKYPEFDITLENVEETGMIQAFSKNFAVDKDYKVLYKANVVGGINTQNKVKLSKKFEFLKQELEAEVKNVLAA